MTSEELHTLLSDILDRVHDGFTYVTDEEQYGEVESWDMPDDVDNVSDDCDGFALACRQLVREAGLESRLVICKTETGEGHMVLAVGNYILDNRYNRVKLKSTLERVGYEWVYVSGLEKGDLWFKYDND